MRSDAGVGATVPISSVFLMNCILAEVPQILTW